MPWLAGRTIDGKHGKPAAACALFLLSFVIAFPAHAQISANVAVMTSEIFHGESTSDDDAAASLEVSYDHPSGVFAGVSVTLAGGENDLHVNGSTEYIGYALRRGVSSFEIGVIHRDYNANSLFDVDYSPHYVQGFVGMTRNFLKLRLYVSPDYLRDGRTSYYGEINDRLLRSRKWSLSGHGGVSAIPPELGNTAMRFYYDWRLQASRPLGRFTFSLGVAGTNYRVFAPDEGPGFLQNKPRMFASISRAF